MSRIESRRRQRSGAEVRELVAEYRRSGASVAEFAARRLIPTSTMYSYLAGKPADRRSAKPKLIAVRVTQAAKAPEPAATIAIELRDSLTLRVPVDISTERLAEMVRALR